MPARLRMNSLRTHGVEHTDFELWCTTVSAINGCGQCMDAHKSNLREQSASEEVVIAAIRIASVVHGLAAVLDAEKAVPTTAAVGSTP